MQVRSGVPLAPFTTLEIGGPALRLVEVGAEGDIDAALGLARELKAPFFTLGGGSNLLVADSGFPGVVARIGIVGVRRLDAGPGEAVLRVGAGEPWDGFVGACVREGLQGIEC